MSPRMIQRLGALVAMCAALGSTACESPTVPPRIIAYQFALEGFAEPVVYRWPDGHTIRVHVLPSDDPELARLLDDAFAHTARVWNDAVLYGEYRIERAPLERADVVIAWANQTLPLDTEGCHPLPAGAAWTTFCRDLQDPALIHTYPLLEGEHEEDGVHMIVQLLSDQADAERVAALVAHEFGHVLGIGTHPCDFADAFCERRRGDQRGADDSLMFEGIPDRLTPSPADRATIEVLYHTTPDLTPP